MSAGAQTSIKRTTLTDTVLPITRTAKSLGSTPPTTQLHLAIGLNPRFPAELKAFADDVSNPSSPNYRHYMTPSQLGEAFGASPGDVNAVVSYLKGQGMKVSFVSPSRNEILVEATVGQAQTAFGTQIKTLQGPDYFGKTITFYANTTPLSIPTNLASTVLTVEGTESYDRPIYRTTILTPALARGLYNSAPAFSTGFTGAGVKLAVSNFDGIRLTNIPLFVTQYGLPVPVGGSGSNVHNIDVVAGGSTGSAGGEGDLDIQMELGNAPLADIYVYSAPYSKANYTSVLTREQTDNTADIISESYGWVQVSDAQSNNWHNLHLLMSAQGQSYLVASGDNGTADMGKSTGDAYTSADPFPDIDPEVTNVGGTVANANATTGARITEDGWSGSGGGWFGSPSVSVSYTINTLPSWQHGTGVPTTINKRLVPDVGLHAAGSGTGAYYFYTGGALQNGYIGTSFSSPVFAGQLGLLEQRLAAAGLTRRLGRLNDMIYAENGRADVWHDITTGNSGTLPDGTAATGHAGWDFVTGWGPPDFDAWFNVLLNRPMTGNVLLQSLFGSPAGTVVTVQVYNAGTSTLVDTKTAALDGSGNFTILTPIPNGSYDVYVKASHWLRRKQTSLTLTNAGVSGLSFSLIDGDVNGDNGVTLGDFAVLRAAYGSSAGDGNWNPSADLNGDGAVTLGDFAILRASFGLNGD